MYYTVIKHSGHLRTLEKCREHSPAARVVYISLDEHLRTRGKCRQHEPQASVLYISQVFSNARSVLSQCNTRLRLLHLLYDIEVMWRKTIKHAFSMFYTLIKRGFLSNQSARRILSILYIYIYHFVQHDQGFCFFKLVI